MMSFAPKRRMGWLPDYPDFRDYTEDTQEIKTILMTPAKGKRRASTAALPPAVDRRPWCSPVEGQGALGSCTAHAGVGIIEPALSSSKGDRLTLKTDSQTS